MEKSCVSKCSIYYVLSKNSGTKITTHYFGFDVSRPLSEVLKRHEGYLKHIKSLGKYSLISVKVEGSSKLEEYEGVGSIDNPLDISLVNRRTLVEFHRLHRGEDQGYRQPEETIIHKINRFFIPLTPQNSVHF